MPEGASTGSEARQFTIPGCSKCHSPLEASGYDGDLECPNAQYPNKTKHGRYHSIDLVVVVVEVRGDDSTGVVEVVEPDHDERAEGEARDRARRAAHLPPGSSDAQELVDHGFAAGVEFARASDEQAKAYEALREGTMADRTWTLEGRRTMHGSNPSARVETVALGPSLREGETALVVEEHCLREAEAERDECAAGVIQFEAEREKLREELRRAHGRVGEVEGRVADLEVKLEKARAYGLKQRQRAQDAEDELFRVRTRLSRS